MRTQLQWLQDTLLSAEVASESVHILGHVPPNTASCVYTWNREYDKIVRRFAHIISGQFFGHTHRDEFNVFYLKDEKSQNAAVNVAWNAGSGTTFVGFNSNYRIYYAEPTKYVSYHTYLMFLFSGNLNPVLMIRFSQQIIDHETWIFNLTEANLNPSESPKWFKEYSFKDAFNLSDLSPKSLGEMLENWKNDTAQLTKVND